MSRLFLIPLVGSLFFLVGVGPQSCAELAKFGEPEFLCVSTKQRAAGKYSHLAFLAWSKWETEQDDVKREEELARAGAELADAFAGAEWRSALLGVDCVEQTVTASDLEAHAAAAVEDVVTAIEAGLDLQSADDAMCAGMLLKAAGKRTRRSLRAEANHTLRAPNGGDAETRDSMQESAAEGFSMEWSNADCPTDANESDVASQLDALGDHVVFHTAVSPVLDDTEFQAISPTGPIEYEGRALEPRCGFDDDPDYHFFVKRGSVNKVVMYYQGGGACWETPTVPVTSTSATPTRSTAARSPMWRSATAASRTRRSWKSSHASTSSTPRSSS
jgi:hypothetical protein